MFTVIISVTTQPVYEDVILKSTSADQLRSRPPKPKVKPRPKKINQAQNLEVYEDITNKGMQCVNDVNLVVYEDINNKGMQ